MKHVHGVIHQVVVAVAVAVVVVVVTTPHPRTMVVVVVTTPHPRTMVVVVVTPPRIIDCRLSYKCDEKKIILQLWPNSV
jgi:hypothetical protein